jgi:hypothetical protein
MNTASPAKPPLLAFAVLAAALAAPATRAQTVAHQVVAFSGDILPGASSISIATIESASASGDGRVAFHATIAGPGVTGANNEGIWTVPSGLAPNQLVARKGGMAPWGTAYQTFASPKIGPAGHVAFVTDNGGVIEGSLFGIVGQPGALGSLLFNGMPAPSKSPRKFLIFHLEMVNASGVGVAEATLDDISSKGIWVGVPGHLQKLAATGDAATGLGTPGTTFVTPSEPSINQSGTVAFRATLSGEAAFADSIWRGTPGSLVPILRRGSTLPNGEVITSLGSPAINDADVVALRAGTTTVTDGIWMQSPSGLQRHISVGQAAPSTGGRTFASFKTISINQSGQIAFEAGLSGDSSTAQSLWRREPDGRLVLVVQAGMALPVRGGTAALSQFFIDKRCLAENGDVFFRARFGTGSGANWGVYRASVSQPADPITATKPPVVKLAGGGVFRTTTARVRLHGSAVSGGSPLHRVEFRPGKAKAYSRAGGTAKWSARPNVPRGRSSVLVRAVAADGKISKPTMARVLRTK